MKRGSQFTMWMAPAGAPEVSMSVHPDERAHAYCCAYEDRTPIMSVSHQGLRLTITPAGDRHTGQADVRFARALTAAATRYLAEVERFISAADTSEAA